MKTGKIIEGMWGEHPFVFKGPLNKHTCWDTFQMALDFNYPFEIAASFTVEGECEINWRNRNSRIKQTVGDLHSVDSEKKVRPCWEVQVHVPCGRADLLRKRGGEAHPTQDSQHMRQRRQTGLSAEWDNGI